MKKKILILLVLVLCVALASQAVFASVSKERQKRVLNVSSTDYKTINSTHRVVAGSALRTTNNSYWDKYVIGRGYDYIGGSSTFTAEEIAYMKTAGMAAGGRINHLVDLTGKTVVTDYGCSFGSHWHGIYDSFNKYFPDTSRTYATSSYETEMLDPYTTVVYENKVITTEKINYQLIAYYCESPIVLDLDDNAMIDTAKNKWLPHDPQFFKHNAKFFDINGDGTLDYTEWMKADPNDALLVMPDAQGKVNTALELFGTAGGYADGYEKLSIVCDKDKNGWVEGEELKGLKLWIDSNNDAVCDASELKELSDYNVAKIATSHKDFASTYVTTDGKVKHTWDWWPTIAETRKFKRN